MSSIADRLAASLEPMSSETKMALARILMAQTGMSERKPPTKRKASLLSDTRTVAELWLAGEDASARNRAIAKAEKNGGEYRSILVTFADGLAIRTGSYMTDDEHAKAGAVRFARARAMERVFAERRVAWLAECESIRKKLQPFHVEVWKSENYPTEPDPFCWVRLPDGSSRKTRACVVPDVAHVDFVPCEPEEGLFTLTQGGQPMNLYQSMLAVVDSDPTLCQQFKSDLTTHDKAFVERVSEDETFLWFPYEYGTHLLRFVDLRNPAAPLVDTIYNNFCGVRAFVVERGQLREITRERATAIAHDGDEALRRKAQSEAR